jgi:DNA invertase Pin-like site-specific DNA recombinase
MTVALYARVSTDNQELQPQVNKLQSWAEDEGVEHTLFSEQASSVKERPEFDDMMERLEEFDYVVVTKLDRLGRSLREMLANIDTINEDSGGLVVIDDDFNIDTRDEQSLEQEIITKFLSLFAEVERRMIRRRMEEGYEKAKEEGRVGRPAALSEDEKSQLVGDYESGKYTWEGLSDKYDVSTTTISNVLQERGIID